MNASVKAVSPKGCETTWSIEGENSQELTSQLTRLLDWLEKTGFSPTVPVAQNGNGYASGNGAAPVCQYHGPMKRSTKYSGWYCPSKMGDGTYCKEKVTD